MQNVFGLVSGFDAGAIIDATVEARRAPIQQLQSQKSGIQTQISKLGEIKSKLGDLQTALADMRSLDEILSLSGASSNEDTVGVSANTDASPASYSLEVTQLATAEKNRSTAYASAAGEVRAGTLSIAVNGGDAVDITMEDGDTLQDVVERINASDAAVDATILHDGNGGYHLQVSGRETGYSTATASEAIEITESYTGGAGQELGLTEVVTARNAQFTLDGLAIETTSNSVSDIIAGVTLDLHAEGTSTVEIARDKEGTKEKIQAFVDAFNEVLTKVDEELFVDENTNRRTSLVGDPVVQGLDRKLTEFVSGQLEGLDGPFSSLSQLGIKTDSTGKLAIDDAELDAALDQNMTAVGQFFVAENVGLSDRLEDALKVYTRTGDGLFITHDKALNGRVDRIDDRISAMDDRLEAMRDRMVRQFTAMENAMARFQAQGQSLSGLLAG